jgi:hypothetical protein
VHKRHRDPVQPLAQLRRLFDEVLQPSGVVPRLLSVILTSQVKIRPH